MAQPVILHKYERVTDYLSDLLDEQEMTQKELAKQTGIDPSHVSRSLNGDREASYEKVYDMWTVLKQEDAEEKVTAEDVMQPNIEWAYHDETVQEVGERAMENEYTQLPVRQGGDHIGWITTDVLVEPDGDSTIESLVHDRGFTTVPLFLDLETLEEYLKDEYRALLVKDDDESRGIITPHDLVEFKLSRE